MSPIPCSRFSLCSANWILCWFTSYFVSISCCFICCMRSICNWFTSNASHHSGRVKSSCWCQKWLISYEVWLPFNPFTHPRLNIFNNHLFVNDFLWFCKCLKIFLKLKIYFLCETCLLTKTVFFWINTINTWISWTDIALGGSSSFFEDLNILYHFFSSQIADSIKRFKEFDEKYWWSRQ